MSAQQPASNVVEFVSRERVEEAWDGYAQLARQLHNDPSLLSDRSFNESLARAHERWRKLFLLMEPV